MLALHCEAIETNLLCVHFYNIICSRDRELQYPDTLIRMECLIIESSSLDMNSSLGEQVLTELEISSYVVQGFSNSSGMQIFFSCSCKQSDDLLFLL